MKINLREIIDIPGASVPFSCTLDTERLDFPSLVGYLSPPSASGRVTNSAGALTLTGEIETEAEMTCDRCLETYLLKKTIPLSVPLATELQDENSDSIFLLDGDWLDLDEVLETCFILEMDIKSLCGEDCAGLCPVCGVNRNETSCNCGSKSDPRLAVLEQLLDTE